MLKIAYLRAPRCACSAEGELRRCAGNRGIGWRCPRCLAPLSKWLRHADLLVAGVNIGALPAWDQPAHDDRQVGLPL
jgi:hypothetical protein